MLAKGYSFVNQREPTHGDVVWESSFKRYNTLQIFYLGWGKGDVESLDVLHEMFDFPSANDREDVWCFVHQVRDSN